MHRLFVALRPPRAARAALLGRMEGVSRARWQDDDQLHLTLRYIGEVDGATAEDVVTALAGVRHPPVNVTLSGCGVFERRGRVDTLWIGAQPREPLAALHRKIDRALVRAGLPPEGRAYLPHVTLARFGSAAGDVAGFVAGGGAAIGPFAMDAFCLFESRLGAAGATYEAVARYPLVE